MKRMLVTLAGCLAWLIAAVALPTAVSAGDAKEPKVKSIAVNHRNEQYDLNKDGKLEGEEITTMKADRAAKRQARLLAKYDANKNGQLDPEEEAAHKADLEKRRQQRLERKKAKEAEKAAAAAQPAEDEDDDEENAK